MYILILLLLLAASAALVYRGVARRSPLWVAGGGGLVLATAGFYWLMGFYAEWLWFESLGYTGRFWTLFWARLLCSAAGGVAGLAVVGGLVLANGRKLWPLAAAGAVLGGLIGANWGYANTETLLKFAYGVSTGVSDPILGADVGFYLFTLPALDSIFALGVLLTLIALGLGVVGLVARIRPGQVLREAFGLSKAIDAADRPGRGLYAAGVALLAWLAFGVYLRRFHLMYSDWGAVRGAGWTDVHVRLPAYVAYMVLLLALAAVLAARPLRDKLLDRRFREALAATPGGRNFAPLASVLAVGAVGLVCWVLLLGIVPGLVQWLLVEPNEVTRERPFIKHNIEFTREAFGLAGAEQFQFAARKQLTRQQVAANRGLFENVRLWDWRALEAVYKQFQEIRLYYEFIDVDVDRYRLDGAKLGSSVLDANFGPGPPVNYRQVMVSAREMNIDNLPADSQTFVNRHFKYTHGFGLTMTTVNDFTPQGRPDLLVKDIPPVWELDELAIDEPRIYYGELTDNFVVANSSEEEFDYPQGDRNVYNRYDGAGGVQLSGLWRRLVYGWKFDSTRLVLSGYPTPDSRILFRRQIKKRLAAVAPFLQVDRDPYIVLADGRLVWVLDAYTVSNRYPYSEPYDGAGEMGTGLQRGRRGPLGHLRGVNYIRNSVKVVIDAYNGSVDLYVMDPKDPILRVWRRIYPALFKAREKMPDSFARHIRYPADYLLIQGLVYAKYHMTDPMVFYNQEDLWVRATEKYYQNVQPVEPYYIMWQPPDSDQLEYILMLPFTPKNRQVLIGWIAGMCDGENYGRFLAYRFPKGQRLLGPQQVETKIDQDPDLSARLTLWDQRGSSVIRGNVLAIPVDDTLMYVEPIYLRAETAAYPELRLVVVMHGDDLSYGETFQEALVGLFGPGAPGELPPGPDTRSAEAATRPAGPVTAAQAELIGRANAAFEAYLKHTGAGDFDRASAELNRLRRALRQLAETAKGGG